MMFTTSQSPGPKIPGAEHYPAFLLQRLAPSTYFLKDIVLRDRWSNSTMQVDARSLDSRHRGWQELRQSAWLSLPVFFFFFSFTSLGPSLCFRFLWRCTELVLRWRTKDKIQKHTKTEKWCSRMITWQFMSHFLSSLLISSCISTRSSRSYHGSHFRALLQTHLSMGES